MRRSILLAALLAAILLGASAQSASHASSSQRRTVTPYARTLIIGDSVTWGSVASVPNDAYPYQVVKDLRARNNGSAMFYLNWGSPGINTAGMISDLQQMDILPTVDLIIVEIGVVDWGQSTAPATFQAQYVSLLSLLRQNAPNATLVGLTGWQDPAALDGGGYAESQYDSIISDAILNKSGAPVKFVVNLGPLYLNPTYHDTSGTDTYHPNDLGHEAIASAIMGVI